MAEAKREVWVIEDEDGFIVRPCLIKLAAEREAVRAIGERVVRYVPESASREQAEPLERWAVRVLDAWAKKNDTDDAARIAAARALCAEHPGVYPEEPTEER